LLADRLSVIPISWGDAAANRAAFDRHGLRDVLLQHDREVAERYGVHGTPGAVLIAPGGGVLGEVAAGETAIAALIADGASGHRFTDARAARTPAVGEPAPDFELPSASGEPVRLAGLRGHDLVLVFWNPACGFCRRMAERVRTWERGRTPAHPDLVFVTAGAVPGAEGAEPPNDGFESVMVFDASWSVAGAYGAPGTPSAIRIDPDGWVASGLAVGSEAVFALAAPLGEAESEPFRLDVIAAGSR
jgi:hypothetical protein